MKANASTPTPVAVAAEKPVAVPPPAFDPKAVAVVPTRHAETGRTFAFVQGEHLFSATGDFVATVSAEAAAALLPAPAEPTPSA